MTGRPLLFVGILASLTTVLALWAGCGRGEEAPGGASDTGLGPSGEYEVVLVAEDLVGAYVLTSNGFPVEHSPGFVDARLGQEFGAFLTPALLSGQNEAAVEVTPFVRRVGDGVVAGPVRVRVWVEAPDGSVVAGSERGGAASDSAFTAWERELKARWAGWTRSEDSLLASRPALLQALGDSVGADPHASAYGAGPALDSARVWAEANPVRVATAFVRPGGAGRPSDGEPSFDAVFRDAPVIRGTAADSAALRAYAVRLRDLVAAGDGAALYDEFAPALRDNGALHGLPPLPDDTLRARWAAGPSGWAGADPAPLAPSEVGLRSWSGGRVWELYRPGADGLLQGRDGGPYTEVYVGEVDGALRVVRQ